MLDREWDDGKETEIKSVGDAGCPDLSRLASRSLVLGFCSGYVGGLHQPPLGKTESLPILSPH